MQSATMTVREAAKYLNVNSNSMYGLVHQPDFTAALRIGRRILISREALVEWVRNEASKPIDD